jgi:hypothetical protein
MGVKRASQDFWALNTVLFIALLVIQFGLQRGWTRTPHNP